MILYVQAQLLSALIDLLRLTRLSTEDKDLEILILRQQLDVLARKHNQAIKPSRHEKWTIAVLAAALKKCGRLTSDQHGRQYVQHPPAAPGPESAIACGANAGL